MSKLAVFISGPPRYFPWVIKSVKNKLDLLGVEYSIFVALWKDDYSSADKLRGDDCGLDLSSDLLKNVKNISLLDPYSYQNIGDRFGYYSGSPSLINNIIGLFVTNAFLIKSLSSLPDSKDYKYVFRIRTDIAITSSFELPDLSNVQDDELFVCSNKENLYEGFLCDHMGLMKVETFNRQWNYLNFDDFMNRFDASGRHPEKFIFDSSKKANLDIYPKWIRNQDYHLVYGKNSDKNSAVISELYSKGLDNKEIFELVSGQSYEDDISLQENRSNLTLKQRSFTKILLVQAFLAFKNYIKTVKYIYKEIK